MGGVLGVINLMVLRVSVRRITECKQRWQAILTMIGSFALRYVLIGVVVLTIASLGNLAMAVTTLVVLGALIVLLPLLGGKSSCGCG